MLKPARIACVLLSMVAMLVATAALCSAQSLELQRHMQACAVQVKNWQSDGSADCGTGVLIDCETTSIVVTNAHVAARPIGRIELIFSDGRRTSGRVTMADETYDVAHIQPEGGVRGGAKLGCFDGQGEHYLAGFGGGTLAFKPLTLKKMTGVGSGSISLTKWFGQSYSGDSGGGIYNPAGEVVGVNFGCYNDPEGGVYSTCGTAFDQFFAKVNLQQQYCQPCQQGQCVTLPSGATYCPNVSQPQTILSTSRPSSYTTVQPSAPASRIAPPAAASLAASPPRANPTQGCDCRTTIAGLEARIKELESRSPGQGPPGERGPAGPPGPAGAAGKDAQFDQQAVAAAIAAALPPIHVIQRDSRTGETIAEKDVHLGGNLTLNFGAQQPVDARQLQP